ncbi:hypothetical protein XELAEV_18045760mg [Xenopus laevis]|uniref:VLIG-type G domain-containing protein n=1 Tax=Xenopus laevis TaxID=8355 RepID=A0A974C1C2_XENLA|nr:hypothetical protein XELAEV_18045760mg [Xenopus laevis]
MKMEPYENKTLTLQDFLQIDQECLQRMEDWQRESAAWNFIHKVIALNGTARSIVTKNEDENEDLQDDTDDNSVHLLDVLCFVLHCCDNFLKQEIILKMSMCQFAVPLLLPDVDGPGCTFMLWGMRDIVKRWRPQSLAETKGFIQAHLVQISMPTFSFVRLGESKFSKSAILNQVLSPAQHTYDFFVHSNMEGADVPRKISEGLTEISWYFPAGKGNSDIFSEPAAFANLHGNLEDNLKQFAFLTQISSAVFIFVENIDQPIYDFLSQYKNSKATFVIIFKANSKFDKSTNLNNVTVLQFKSKTSEAIITKKIRATAVNFIIKGCNFLKLEDMAEIASKLGISVDENGIECQNAKADAKAIAEEIKDVAQYKKNTMKLQGDLWKNLAELEKEMCQMKKQGDKHGENYKEELKKQCVENRKQQYQCEMPNGISKFIDSIKKRNHTENQYFLKWLRFYLDLSAMNNLSALQAEYKQMSSSPSMTLSELDQKISDSSLGIEHFLRELGQFYEAEHFMLKEENAKKRTFDQLPTYAADLLLRGFPLELIDGDASNIPLQWLQDVLHELDNKTGKCCRMGVITVLGVQSTGKSTLLNTMFGLQFPVSSGRCTRGAFMTLMKVRENFQEELGYDPMQCFIIPSEEDFTFCGINYTVRLYPTFRLPPFARSDSKQGCDITERSCGVLERDYDKSALVYLFLIHGVSWSPTSSPKHMGLSGPSCTQSPLSSPSWITIHRPKRKWPLPTLTTVYSSVAGECHSLLADHSKKKNYLPATAVHSYGSLQIIKIAPSESHKESSIVKVPGDQRLC